MQYLKIGEFFSVHTKIFLTQDKPTTIDRDSLNFYQEVLVDDFNNPIFKLHLLPHFKKASKYFKNIINGRCIFAW